MYQQNKLNLFTNIFHIQLIFKLNLHYFSIEDLPFQYSFNIFLIMIGNS
jgi:hypothetical protein